MSDGLSRKDLLSLEETPAEEINLILDTTETFREVATRPIKKVPTLRGKTLVNLFYEPSTRTRTSFELAAKRLSADVVNITVAQSSAVKGETLVDTVKTIEAMGVEFVVVRHNVSGAPRMLAKALRASVINAGDGAHEHPTQGLLDLYTIRQVKKRIAGLKVTIVGDIAHSRVARSNIWGLLKLGAHVTVAGPPTLIPAEVEKMGVAVRYDVTEAIRDADVVNILRLQLERQKRNLFPSVREYARLFGVTMGRLRLAKPDVLLMHPGPMNRGVEIGPDVAELPNSVINNQVTNGVAVRMAVLYLLAGGGIGAEASSERASSPTRDAAAEAVS